MRFLRAFLIAFFAAVVACILSFFVGDYLTKLAHVLKWRANRA
jgi:membrane protein DedA with SNARE-associated domain